MNVAHVVEAGRIFVPCNAQWLSEFERELTLFPNARNDDQVDSLSQFLHWAEEERSSGPFLEFI